MSSPASWSDSCRRCDGISFIAEPLSVRECRETRRDGNLLLLTYVSSNKTEPNKSVVVFVDGVALLLAVIPPTQGVAPSQAVWSPEAGSHTAGHIAFSRAPKSPISLIERQSWAVTWDSIQIRYRPSHSTRTARSSTWTLQRRHSPSASPTQSQFRGGGERAPWSTRLSPTPSTRISRSTR